MHVAVASMNATTTALRTAANVGSVHSKPFQASLKHLLGSLASDGGKPALLLPLGTARAGLASLLTGGSGLYKTKGLINKNRILFELK
jgi:hypothetical protein